LAASLLLAAVAIHAETLPSRKTPPVTVYTTFQNGRSELVFEHMKAELAAIMEPIGLWFEWRSLDGNGGNEVSVELVVVTMKGHCSMDAVLPPTGTIGPLGWTHMSDGDVLPFCDLDCDRVRKFIHPMLIGVSQPERDRKLGQALGRVLAHELYHIFANTTRHASGGVAKPYYTAVELVSNHFNFESKESRTLREVKVRNLLRSAGMQEERLSAAPPAAGQ
jgi:hypothetical protein